MYYFIVNPNAKSGKGRIIWQKVCHVMNSKGLAYEVLFTEKKGQAAELARKAAEQSNKPIQGKRTNLDSVENFIRGVSNMMEKCVISAAVWALVLMRRSVTEQTGCGLNPLLIAWDWGNLLIRVWLSNYWSPVPVIN